MENVLRVSFTDLRALFGNEDVEQLKNALIERGFLVRWEYEKGYYSLSAANDIDLIQMHFKADGGRYALFGNYTLYDHLVVSELRTLIGKARGNATIAHVSEKKAIVETIEAGDVVNVSEMTQDGKRTLIQKRLEVTFLQVIDAFTSPLGEIRVKKTKEAIDANLARLSAAMKKGDERGIAEIKSSLAAFWKEAQALEI